MLFLDVRVDVGCFRHLSYRSGLRRLSRPRTTFLAGLLSFLLLNCAPFSPWSACVRACSRRSQDGGVLCSLYLCERCPKSLDAQSKYFANIEVYLHDGRHRTQHDSLNQPHACTFRAITRPQLTLLLLLYTTTTTSLCASVPTAAPHPKTRHRRCCARASTKPHVHTYHTTQSRGIHSSFFIH